MRGLAAGCGVPAAPHGGADHADGLVSSGARQEPARAPLALASGRPADGSQSHAQPHGQRGERGSRDHPRGRLELGTPSRKDFATRVREMAGNEPELMAMLEPLLAVLASMMKELAKLTKRVLDIVKHEETCRQLMTTPSAACWPRPFQGSDRRPPGLRWHRPDQRAHLPRHHRPTGAVRKIARRRCASGPDAEPISVRRNGHHGQDQPLRRRTRPHRPGRGRAHAFGAQHEMVGAARLGLGHCQAPRHGQGQDRGRPKARRDPAPDVARRQRFPLRQGGPGLRPRALKG